MKKLTALVLTWCMLMTIVPAFTVSVSAASWTDGWTMTGNGAAVKDGKILLNSASGEIKAVKNWQVSGGKFDVSFTMKINSLSGSNNIQICTGQYRAMMVPGSSGFKVSSSNGTILATINYPIGTDVHEYRILGNQKRFTVLIDGYYIQEFDAEVYSAKNWIEFWGIGNANNPLNIEIHDFAINSVQSDVKSGIDTTYNDDAIDAQGNIPPGNLYEDFEDPNKDYKRWQLRDSWKIENGTMGALAKSGAIERTKTMLGFKDEFRLTIKAKTTTLGANCGLQLFWPGYKTYMLIKKDRLDLTVGQGSVSSQNFDSIVDGKWHEYTIEGYNYGRNVRFYVDGVLVSDNEAAPNDRTDYHVYIYCQPIEAEYSELIIDEFNFETWDNNLEIATPFEGAEYLSGRTIDLQAKVSGDSDIPYVDYKINGQTVATGKAPDYKAELSGIVPGSYIVTACYEDQKSPETDFTVVPAVEGNLKISYGDDKTAIAAVAFYDKYHAVSSVEYRLNGNLIGTSYENPYTMPLGVLPAEAATLSALCRDKNGLVVSELTEKVFPPLDDETCSVNYSTEVAYTVEGAGGSGSYELKNGNHRLYLNHTKDAVTYLTDRGEESFSPGTGRFEIITEGPTADVYRNGQLAFSMIMPQTNEVGQRYEENGLNFTDKAAFLPQERGNYFVKRNVTDKNAVYHTSGLSYIHNLDFVADRSDAARMVVNDGYYRTDLELKDGKFYAWTTKFDSSEPFCKELASALEADNVYYRVETTAGMSRLYGNGRWLASFRNMHTSGENTVAINVTGGDGLSYLAVSDNTDVYLYRDDFKKTAEFDSMSYFQLQNGMSAYVDPSKGTMLLNALDKTDAMAEISAYVGDATLSADVTVNESNGGFYFLTNHSTTKMYSKIGYNFKTGNYEVVYMNEGTVYEPGCIRIPGDFPVGEKVHMELRIRMLPAGREIALLVNGEPKIVQVKGADRRGKIGFIADDAVAYVESLSYRADSRPVLSETETVMDSTYFSASHDLIDKGDEVVVVGENKKSMTTSDGGKTWNVNTTPKEGYSFNIVQLMESDGSGGYRRTGECISVYREKVGQNKDGVPTYDYITYYSKDNGDTWERRSFVDGNGVAGRITMNNRITQGRSGRVYYACCDNNNEDYGYTSIWYTDDKGKTWTRSENDLDAKKLGYCIQEVVCLETESGVVRAYFRNNMGFVHYMNSYDYGKTWDMEHIYQTPFLSALNCYNIELDPYDMKTLYAAWGYDNANLHGIDQWPRTRWALARSYDGGETWEYLGTVHENNGSGLVMMNLNVGVTKDYIFMDAFSSNDMSTDSQSWGRTVVIDKKKLKGTKDFEQLHMASNEQIEITSLLTKKERQTSMLVSDKDGCVVLNDYRIENAAIKDGVEVNCAAAFIGAAAEENADGSVTLRCGASAIVLGDILEKDGRKYIKTETFAKRFGLTLSRRGDTQIIGQSDWNDAQKQCMNTAISMFAEEF